MRVLLSANVSESRGGGVATYVCHVADGVEKLGASVDVLWGKPSPRWIPGPSATLRFASEIAAIASRGWYDVVAVQGGEGAMLKPGGPGRVVTSHGDERASWKARQVYAPIPFRQRFVTPYATIPVFVRAVKRADVVIALREDEASRFREERQQDADTVHTVPNGCGPLHVNSAPVLGQIVFVGNWLPRKGSLIIPELFRAVRRADPKASLTLVGPESTVLSRFHQDDRRYVQALGFVARAETERILNSADVLVMPSYCEGMPLAVLEALSFGIPTVGFDVGGTAAAGGAASVLVPAGDVDGCANALVRVIGDRGLRRRLSEEAFARAAGFTWAATAEKTLAAYEHAARVSRYERRPWAVTI